MVVVGRFGPPFGIKGWLNVISYTDPSTNLADYRRVVQGLDVSQAPSIVIVDRSRKGTLLEGYIDAASLRQAVADVAR